MKIIMDDLRLTNLSQIKNFLKGSQGCGLRLLTLAESLLDRGYP
jgi:hypothetical protein